VHYGNIALVVFGRFQQDGFASEVNERSEGSSMMPYWKAATFRFLGNRAGQDLIEYALVAGFVAVAAAAIFPNTLMPDVSMIFSKLDIYFSQAATQGN